MELELVAEHRNERERFIQGFMKKLSDALNDAGIHAEVKGRPKHIYSIWRKMQRKGLDFHELFDVKDSDFSIKGEGDGFEIFCETEKIKVIKRRIFLMKASS